MKIFFILLFLLLLLPFESCGMQGANVSYVDDNSEELADGEYVSQGIVDVLDKDLLYVAVTGCVKKPGVYILSSGARVYEAINAAGGITEDGNVTNINLVEVIKDGTTINVKSRHEATGLGNEIDDGLIDINSATLSELVSITGIGESKAKAIIAYREKNGQFNTIEDIMKVSGIKEGTFEAIKEYITVR